MPSGSILERSVLLTPSGWRRCGNKSTELDVIGLDRAGTPQAGRIRLELSSVRSRVAFVGTATAAGEFAEATRLLLAAGDAVDLRQVIATESASELQFETFRIDARPQGSPQQAKSLWEELQALSATADPETAVIRCAEQCTGKANRAPAAGLMLVEDGDTTYLVVTRRAIEESLHANADSMLLAIANACFHRSEENRWELEADSTLLVMWLLDALRRAGIRRSAQYDSLQHSCFVFIDLVSTDPAPLGPGRCAFLSSRSSNEIRIEWSDPSWTPVVSGFLLSPKTG